MQIADLMHPDDLPTDINLAYEVSAGQVVARFVLPGIAQVKERARAAPKTEVVNAMGEVVRTIGGHHYTPEKTRQWETTVRNAATRAMTAQDRQLMARWMYLKARARTAQQNGRAAPLTRPEQAQIREAQAPRFGLLMIHYYVGEEKAKRGDLDNYIKSVADGLNGVTYWDDGQIDDGRQKHLYRRAIDACQVIVWRSGDKAAAKDAA